MTFLMMATKRKATGMDGFNILLSRKYLKLEKPIMKIQQRHGKWFRKAEFQGEKLMIKGKTWTRVRDALGDKMTIMIKAVTNEHFLWPNKSPNIFVGQVNILNEYTNKFVGSKMFRTNIFGN